MPASRIALVHERFTEVAGSEHVVEQLAKQWPSAEIFAALAHPDGIPRGLPRPPRTTSVDRYYGLLCRRSYAPLTPLIPRAFRRLDLSDLDAVVVSHHAFATQAVFATAAPVVAYVHSPARWAWDPSMRGQEAGGRAGAAVLAGLARLARSGEVAAAPKLRTIVANSTAVAHRISQWWNRDALVVHPPVDTEGFTPDHSVPREDFYLLAGRLVPYKRPDLAIAAANEAGVNLVVAGDGRAMKLCRQIAGPKTTFLGRVPHDELLNLHRRARALLMPGVEDFGIVPVESMATGTPVIALGEGGAVDSVVPGLSGELVTPGSDEAIIDGFASAISTFICSDYDRTEIRRWAERFSRQNFRARMQEVVDEATDQAYAAGHIA
jgi:glycosyltransferase involved in cell wall biosynthesis